MSKKRKRIAHPDQLSINFDEKIQAYQHLKEEILEACEGPSGKQVENADEACIEVAAAIKRAIRQTNMSREQVVDAVNEFFGWPTIMEANRRKGTIKHLSIHMFNHFLSKPTEYPIPTFYIYAIQHITGSLEPTRALAEPEDARVISGAEVRQMALGKLDETITEMQRLKKELKGLRHG